MEIYKKRLSNTSHQVGRRIAQIAILKLMDISALCVGKIPICNDHPEKNIISLFTLSNKSLLHLNLEMESIPIFKKGAVYALINKAEDLAMRPREVDPKKYNNSKVVGVPFNPQDDTQLFIIQKVGKGIDDYQLVNIKSGLVITEDGKDILLEYWDRESTQLFAITDSKYPGFFPYYWIKTSEKGDRGLYYEGILKYGIFDPNAENHLWRFEEVTENNTITQSFMLINRYSSKALDVPGGSLSAGERIIQYQINRRFNQRWRWIKHDKGYVIQSIHSGLFLDIAGESRESGAKVIQWKWTGHPNQQWLAQAAQATLNSGCYKIRSIHQPTMYLAIKGESLEDEGKLEVSKMENPSMYWIIEGALP